MKALGSVKMETYTKDISVQIARTAKESLDGQTAIFIQDNFVMTCDKVWEEWNGEMAVYMKVNGKGDYQMAEVFELINSQALSEQTDRNLDLDFSKTTS